MRYTCPKCGKNMELSTEVLINSGYKVICPQCLSQLQIVGDYAYIPNEDLELDITISPSQTINCPRCGHEASTGTHFCPNCGTSFDSTTPGSDPVATIDAGDVTVLPPPVPNSNPNSDPLYNEVVKFLMTCNSITPMMLRDRFHITDERAAELIRQLEAGGVIGPYNNGGPRQILIPHQAYYERTTQGQPLEGLPPRGLPRHRGMGCLSWAFYFLLFILLMKMCGL